MVLPARCLQFVAVPRGWDTAGTSWYNSGNGTSVSFPGTCQPHDRGRSAVRVLLIAYSYPPDPMVGSFRPAKVARALRAAGHDVDVVTARMPGETASVRPAPDGIRVHPVRALRNPRHAYVWLKTKLAGSRDTSAGAPVPSRSGLGAGATPPARRPGWRRYAVSLLWVPDENQGFIPTALRKARLLARGGIDLIYTTAPPFSDHLVGWALKRLTGAPWVMELRDPWGGRESRNPDARSALADRVNNWLEHRCLRAADKVIAVSAPVYAQLEQRMGTAARERLYLVLNGIDEVRSAPPQTATGRPFRIIHTGSLYNDPRPFLTAVGAVVARRELGPTDLQVEFIGAEPGFDNPTVDELAARLGLTGMVSFSGWIPQSACRARIDDADLLLLLCRGFPTAIPNKLFDYLGARKPILGIVDPGGESDAVLRSQEGHLVVDGDDAGSIEACLEQALDERLARRRLLNDPDFLAAWSTSSQMKRLLDIIGAGSGSPASDRSVYSGKHVGALDKGSRAVARSSHAEHP